MALVYGPFNSVNKDRLYESKWFAEYFNSFISNGVFPNPSTGMQVVEKQDLSLTIKTGKVFINGYHLFNDTDYTITIEPPNAILPRIDRVVVRWDLSDRDIKLIVLKGIPSNVPVPPVITRDGETYDLVLADVRVNAAAIVISQANITDQRLNNQLCGIVHAVVDQVDTTSIFNQYQGWFDEYSSGKAADFNTWEANTKLLVDNWINSEQADFLDWRATFEQNMLNWETGQQNDFIVWFNNIKGQLDTDAAGHLQNEIDDHLADPLPHKTTDPVTNLTYKVGIAVIDGDFYFKAEEV